MLKYIQLVTMLLILASKAAAQTKMVDPDPVPDASFISPDALNDAVRASLASAAAFLIDQASTNLEGFVTDPIRRKQISGYARTETYETRYSKKTFERPVYKYEYEEEEYEEFVVSGGTSTASRQMKKVKRIRRTVVGKKQVGTQKYEQIVGDPNGSIVRIHTRQLDPIYEGAPDIWPRDYCGVNAMALYALLRSGVSPATEEVRKLARALVDHVEWYGAPDMTWDVAWLNAAFANLPPDALPGHSLQKKYIRLRNLLGTKLLEGQLTDGPGRGLWGPVCINTKLLAAMVAYEDTLNKELANRKARQKQQPNARSRQEKVAKAEQALEGFIDSYRGVARQGIRFKSATQIFNAAPNDWTPKLFVQGLPYDIYNQALVDMESTSVALHAIRELARHDLLPKVMVRPEAIKGKAIAPPQSSSAILARCASALSAAQQKSGAWNESNIHQSINYFDAFGFLELDADKLFKLYSHSNPMTTAQAYGALTDAGSAVGIQKLLGRFARNVSAGSRQVRKEAEGYLSNKISNTPPVGRELSPYDYVFRLNSAHRAYGGPEEDRRDLYTRMAHRLLHLQDSDGAWSAGKRKASSPSSVWAWHYERLKRTHDQAQAKLPAKARKPYIYKNYRDPRNHRRVHHVGHHEWVDTRIVSTAYAMLYLLEGVRPPVAAYLKEGAKDRPPSVLTKTIDAMSRREGLYMTYRQVTPEVSGRELAGTPLIVLNGNSTLLSAKSRAALQEYLARGGMAFVQVDPKLGTGLGQKLESMVRGGESRSVPADSEIFASFKGQKPSMDGIYNGKGELKALIAKISSLAQLSGSVQVVYHLIKSRLPPDFFESSFPAPMVGDHAVARVQAMQRLDGEVMGAVFKAEADAQQSKPGAKKTVKTAAKDDDALPEPAVQEEEALKEDEMW